MKHTKKASSQREGGRSAPIEIADSYEPQPKSEPTSEEDELSRFIVDSDHVDYGETARHRSKSSDIHSRISEESFLDDLPADIDIKDDRPIAQKLRRRAATPPNYKHCYQESIQKNHFYSNGKLVRWDEGDTANEDGDFEQSEVEELFNGEGEDFIGARDIWGAEVNKDPFTANPRGIDNVNAGPSHQNNERLPKIPTTRQHNSTLNIPQAHRAHTRRSQADHYTTNTTASEAEADPRSLVEGGLNFLEGSLAGEPELHPTPTQRLRVENTSSFANTTRKRTRAPSQEDLSTILLTNERPTIHDRIKVTATAAKLHRQVLPSLCLQNSSTLATHTDIESGLPTPSTSSASAPASLLDSTALLYPRSQEDPDIDDDTTNTAKILCLRQQFADLTAQLAVERAENADLQTAFDGMARRCARLIRAVGELKAREGERN